MDLINWILERIVGLLDALLPAIGLSPEFLANVDSAMTIIIDLLNTAGYFIPLDVLLMCFMVMIAVDNATLLLRLGQWVIKLIRG